MCGIIGTIRFDGRPVDESALACARDSLTHRGPDDAGLWVSGDGRVGLGHRRLSIVDLSPLGRQPLTNENGTVWITYNGEIYNFGELRAELDALGHQFRSHTDTEVIVHAYEEWGDDCVHRLRGMFAFGIWDARRDRMLLVRDRLGIKPLYYYCDAESLTFASELKAIESFGGLDLSIDESALYDFLTYLYVPTPKTPYTRVRKLAPGHTLVVEGGRAELHRYWDLEFGRGPADVSGVRDLLADAVRSHLVADVPVGALLSGGIDSSTVVALAQQAMSEPLMTFAIGFGAEERSETRFARSVAESLGTEHFERTVTVADASDTLSKVSALYDEPFADSSAIPTLAVCRFARDHVTVALSGDGGDEIFGGYRWYARHLRRARYAYVPSVVREHLPALLERSSLLRLRGMSRLVDGLRPDLERHVAIMGGLTKAQKKRYLRPEVARRFRDYDDLWYFRRYWRDDLDLMARWQYLDTKTYLPDDILTKVDRASMAVGLELRPPLLDHRLVEAVAGLPSDVRTPAGQLKYLLKQIVADLLPAEILTRRKQGFSVPLAAWVPMLGGRPPSSQGGLTASQAWADLMLENWTGRVGQSPWLAPRDARWRVATGVSSSRTR